MLQKERASKNWTVRYYHSRTATFDVPFSVCGVVLVVVIVSGWLVINVLYLYPCQHITSVVVVMNESPPGQRFVVPASSWCKEKHEKGGMCSVQCAVCREWCMDHVLVIID